MPLIIIRADITKMNCDAIVNPTNCMLTGEASLDRRIHLAAGEQLDEECRKLKGCDVGDAKLTRGYNLPAKYVIHTAGPVWRGGDFGEEQLLASCYRRSLEEAVKVGCKSIAFPLISTGTYGYPKDEAIRVARREIVSFLKVYDELKVIIVTYDRSSVLIAEERFGEIKQFIDDVYAEKNRCRFPGSQIYEDYDARPDERRIRRRPGWEYEEGLPAHWLRRIGKMPDLPPAKPEEDLYCESTASVQIPKNAELEKALSVLDESFAQMLFRKIDEAGITDVECYTRANIDRKLFSKIRSKADYHPKKATCLALGLALHLPIDDLKELLMKAGFALSTASKSDMIVQYYVEHGIYDIFEINEALFSFDQALLGA